MTRLNIQNVVSRLKRGHTFVKHGMADYRFADGAKPGEGVMAGLISSGIVTDPRPEADGFIITLTEFGRTGDRSKKVDNG